MAKRIFVTATNTNVGKTHTSKELLREFASRGVSVGAFKPIETGVEDIPLDAYELLKSSKELNPAFWPFETDDIVAFTYTLPASVFVASNNKRLELDKILSKLKAIEEVCDIVIIEGAGGVYVPIDENYMMIDLIKELEACALLVTHCSLGCINDTLLSKRALEEKNIPHAVAFNCKDGSESFDVVSKPYFDHIGLELLKVDRDIEKICDVLYNL